MIKGLLIGLVLLLAIPAGFLISWLARDELIIGRKWFKSVIIVFSVFAGWMALIGRNAEALTALFFVIVSFISYYKSSDKKWTKRRI